MKLLIDNADIEKIKRIYECYPVDGVTTNPSILAAAGRPPYEVLREIRDFIGEDSDLHVQVLSRRAEGIIREAEAITDRLGKKTLVKIPVVPEGLKAIRILSQRGFRVTGTAVYTVQQAYLAGKAGAEYVAPYVNRIDNQGLDGVETTKRIHDLFRNNGMDTGLLAASFKNTRQLLALAEYGIAAATASPSVIENLLVNPAVDGAVDAFVSDFEHLTGAGQTMGSITD